MLLKIWGNKNSTNDINLMGWFQILEVAFALFLDKKKMSS